MADELVSDRVRRRRTRRQLSKDLDVDEATLRRIEEGRTWPTLWVWVALADEFGFEMPADSEPLPDEPLSVVEPKDETRTAKLPDPQLPVGTLYGGPKIEIPLMASEIRRAHRELDKKLKLQREKVRKFVDTFVYGYLEGEFEDTYPIRSPPNEPVMYWMTPTGEPTLLVDEALRLEVPVPYSSYKAVYAMSDDEREALRRPSPNGATAQPNN